MNDIVGGREMDDRVRMLILCAGFGNPAHAMLSLPSYRSNGELVLGNSYSLVDCMACHTTDHTYRRALMGLWDAWQKSLQTLSIRTGFAWASSVLGRLRNLNRSQESHNSIPSSFASPLNCFPMNQANKDRVWFTAKKLPSQ